MPEPARNLHQGRKSYELVTPVALPFDPTIPALFQDVDVSPDDCRFPQRAHLRSCAYVCVIVRFYLLTSREDKVCFFQPWRLCGHL